MDKVALEKAARTYLDRESHAYFTEDLEKVLAENNWEELEDRFYKDLDFGTGGLRGIIGGGDNRLNPFNIRKATQGLANYVKAQGIKNPAAVIAYDSRNFSDLFSKEAALVLGANGIKTYLFSSLRPTPELSYAVRYLKATVGIVVTASHNPPEYNGYKVYWEDGGQLVPPHDKGVIAEVRKVTGDIKVLTEEEALSSEMLVMIDKEIDEPYLEMVHRYLPRPDLTKSRGGDITVVYTPLHGTGTMLMERLFRDMGIKTLTVPEQREPDGGFPTVAFPNPEEPAALKMALDLAQKEKAQLVIGTDPDADRIGIAVPDKKGAFVLLTGNQLGTLMGDYLFLTHQEKGTMPANPRLVKTIVTTEMQVKVAEKYGAGWYDVLTGFKYIGEKIKEFETTGETYVFGGEESYGFLITPEVRDKDALSAAALTAERVLYYDSRGMSFLDRLEEFWKELGYFEETLISKTIKGVKGAQIIKEIMADLRANPPSEIGGIDVLEVRDYQNQTALPVPKAEVIQIRLADDTIVTARPSGTEPKIKFYASLRGRPGESLAEAQADAARRIVGVQAYLATLTNRS